MVVEFHLNSLKFVQTCSACPEQYDVFAGEQKVGYCRLRHGYFFVRCPDENGKVVYESNPQGDGIFEDTERYKYLKKAAHKINEFNINSLINGLW